MECSISYFRKVVTLLSLLLCVTLNIEAQDDNTEGQDGKQVIIADLENEYVKRYLDEVTYTVGSTNQIENYLTNKRCDSPRPVVLNIPIYNPDTVFVDKTDTIYTTKIDTVVRTRIDTLYYVTTEAGIIDTLITQTVDSIVTKSMVTTITILHDTLVTIPKDTLLLCYSLQSDYTEGDTLLVENGLTECSIYNLIPERCYFFKIEVGDSVLTEGEIHTKGRVRMIDVPSLINIRDIGGWLTDDNKRIKYGMIFRGSDLNGAHTVDSTDLEMLRHLGIKAELDLRAWYNDGKNISVFGFLSADSVPVGEVATYLYTDDSGQLPDHLKNSYYLRNWKKEFYFILNNLDRENAVYQHCVWGRDRTGYLSLLLEGLLGVNYDGLIKEYELTCFAYMRTDAKKENIDPVLEYIESMNGETLRDKFNTFFVSKIGVSQSDIDHFREIMLEEASEEPIMTEIEKKSVENSQEGTVYDLNGYPVQSVKKNGIYILKDNKGSVNKFMKQ